MPRSVELHSFGNGRPRTAGRWPRPCDRRRQRRRRLRCEGTAESLATLRGALAATVVGHGLDDLDAAAIRMSLPRAFTQAVSRYVYDSGRFDGVCYRSRYGDDIENWAVFELFTALRPRPPFQVVELTDPDFIGALAIHGLAVEEAGAGD